jgi:hypothetical protein
MYLQKHLAHEFSPGVRQRGSAIHLARKVTLVSGDARHVSAKVRGSDIYHVDLSRTGDEIHVSCECPYFFDAEPVCKHIWATILAADERFYLLGVGGGGPPRLADDLDDDEFDNNDFEEAIASWRPSGKNGRFVKPPPPPPPPKIPVWRTLLRQLNNGRPVAASPREQWSGAREVYYIVDTASSHYGPTGLWLRIEQRDRTKTGKWGKLKPVRISTAALHTMPDPLDREILTTLAGAARPYNFYMGDSIPAECQLHQAAQEILLPKISATGRLRLRTTALAELEALQELRWDSGSPWQFRLAVERQDDSWILSGTLRRDEERMELAEPVLLLEDGILIAHGMLARWNAEGVFHWVALLRKEGRIQAPASHGLDLVAEILQSDAAPEVDWPEELRVEEVTEAPHPLVKFYQPRDSWNKARLRGQLFFDYAGSSIPFVAHSRGLYQPEAKRYVRRDEEAERAAIQAMTDLGLKQNAPMYGEFGPRWEVAAKKLPAVARELMKAGWRVEAEGKTFRHASEFRMELGSGVDWFELHGAADYGGVQVKLPELLKAVDRGDHLVQLGDGSYGILPEEFLRRHGLLTRLGRAHDDHVRFSASQAGLLDVLLAARPEIQVDEVFARARAEIRRFDGIQPVEQPPGFVGQLRGYQCEGLAWMYFLQRLGFGGCLADDMGVGKTPQVLALLETRRQLQNGKKARAPSLVVVPRSLVYNWQQEAARFTPELRVLDHTGTGRERGGESFKDYDLILSTYGTLRRDAALLQECQFDYVILDEAQAIKNEGSESAKAARLLRANHRLVMSGTPIENHLGELWSLFEFLNPGMLGAASPFRGAVLRNPDEETRALLAKALRPFILRRTKAQVAKELPEKTEQTIYCELDETQRKLYNELREHYRQSLLGRIESEGLAKSKIQILEALLRLRQAACHPGLIDKSRRSQASAKLESLIPQLAEVMEGGHKALVFSQFTSFLAILRERLDQEGVVYEYLDGKTTHRQQHIERFQGDPDCKLFLISLKAGGVGLNLTAAEYVFLLDPWWNPAVEAQAIDRTHRIGQTERVFAYRLIAKDTVEEKVLELQKSKRALAEAIIGEDNRLVGNLKREDLELLLS